MAERTIPKKAVGYSRVSGISQIDKGGFPRQEDAIREFAAKHGIFIDRMYREEGVSGTKALQQRKALMEAAAYCKIENCVLLVEKVDRLLRDANVGLMLIAEILSDGVRIFDVSDGQELLLSNDDPMVKLITQFKAILAEWDKNNTIMRLRLGRYRKFEREGRCCGRKPYGHFDNEKAGFNKIMELRARNYSPTAIARILNLEGFKTRFGKPFVRQGIDRIIRNEIRMEIFRRRQARQKAA